MLHIKVTQKGLQKLTDSSSMTGNNDDLQTLRSSYVAKVDGYKSRLIDYLKTDENPDEDVNLSSQDTSFNYTGISIPDNTLNWDEVYKAEAYKTGGYRRYF